MKVTIKGCIHWRMWDWQDDGSFTIDSTDMTNVGPHYVFVREQEFEVEVPDDFDPRPQQIAALKAKKQEVLAEAQAKVTNIEGQIQRLLAIEHKPEVVS